MEILKQFFIDNFSQIWTLVSVVIGGFVTYISTYGIEQRKNELKSQREKVDKILIPFCTCIEKAIKYIDQFNKSDLKQTTSFFNFKINSSYNYTDSDFFNNISILTSYLCAEKRVFLSKSLRADLQKYSDAIENLLKILIQECKECCLEYNWYIESKIINSSFSNGAMYIDVDLAHLSYSKIAAAILGKNELSLRTDIKNICLVINDDPECYKALDFSFDSDFINLYDAIQHDEIEKSDSDDDEVRFKVDLLDFVYESTFDEKETLKSFINKTQSQQLLVELYDLLKKMHKSVIKIIDKVTMWFSK